MAFKSIHGIEGKVFVPEEDGRDKKHPCPDCFACQRCSDDRCRLCRNAASGNSPRDRVAQCGCEGSTDAGNAASANRHKA
jgi:hypothetical protein